MFIKLLDGQYAGEVRDIGNEAAQGLLAQGRAARAFQEDSAQGPVVRGKIPAVQPGGTILQTASDVHGPLSATAGRTKGKKKKVSRRPA